MGGGGGKEEGGGGGVTGGGDGGGVERGGRGGGCEGGRGRISGKPIVNGRHFDRLTGDLSDTQGTVALGGGSDVSKVGSSRPSSSIPKRTSR